MARIRSVHPGLFTDEAFVALSDAAQIFLIGLWTEADDQGIFEWKPVTLRMRLRPTKDGAADLLLSELETANCIRSYELGGRKLGAIRNFRRYQRPKKPNSTWPITPEIGTYVALTAASSELDDDERPPIPQKGEIAPQMEDVGGRMKEIKQQPVAKPELETPLDWLVKVSGIDMAKFRRNSAWVSLPGIWLDWVRQGCDIERDIKPAMEQAILSFKARNGGKPPDGPAYCLKAVLAARDKRLAAETKPVRFEDTGAAFDRRTWERVAEGLMLENLWQAPYGPKPGQDGCLMPADIQAKCLGKPVQVA